MNEPKLRIAGIEAPDAELELSAQDLLELSSSCKSNDRAQEPLAKMMSALAAPSAPVSPKRAPPAAARRSMSASHVAASVIFAIGVVGALYYAAVSYDGAGHSMALEGAPQSQLPASALQSEGEPVRFANPFDAKEVFEFPAGTSDAEARDAVAEILMERAMERQRKFDARVSSNR